MKSDLCTYVMFTYRSPKLQVMFIQWNIFNKAEGAALFVEKDPMNEMYVGKARNSGDVFSTHEERMTDIYSYIVHSIHMSISKSQKQDNMMTGVESTLDLDMDIWML